MSLADDVKLILQSHLTRFRESINKYLRKIEEEYILSEEEYNNIKGYFEREIAGIKEDALSKINEIKSNPYSVYNLLDEIASMIRESHEGINESIKNELSLEKILQDISIPETNEGNIENSLGFIPTPSILYDEDFFNKTYNWLFGQIQNFLERNPDEVHAIAFVDALVRRTVAYVVAKLIEKGIDVDTYYDSHIKPFVDSIIKEINESYIVGYRLVEYVKNSDEEKRNILRDEIIRPLIKKRVISNIFSENNYENDYFNKLFEICVKLKVV